MRRQQRKIDSLPGLLKDLKESIPIDQNTVVKLNSNFPGITMDIIKNQMYNQDRD